MKKGQRFQQTVRRDVTYQGNEVVVRIKKHDGSTYVARFDADVYLGMDEPTVHIHNASADTKYAYTTKSNRFIYLHRYIMDCPKGLVVDHINGDTLDNRRINLEVVTVKENNRRAAAMRKRRAA